MTDTAKLAETIGECFDRLVAQDSWEASHADKGRSALAALSARCERAETALDTTREALEKTIPWIAHHGRSAAQEALYEACVAVGYDPFDWTSHPDVLKQRLAALGISETPACQHENHHFDRSICACGLMHHYCNDCGKTLEPCETPA